MSEKRLWSIDEQGRRLASAFDEAEAPELKRRSRRRRVLVLAPVSVVIAVGLLMATGAFRAGPSTSLSLGDAVAAVAKAAFDAPISRPGQTVYAHSRFTGTDVGFSVGVGTFTAKRQSDTETWYSGGKKGWIRWTSQPLVFTSERDREIYRKVTGGSKGARRIQRRDSIKHATVCNTAMASNAAPTDAASRLHLAAGTTNPTDPSAVYKLLRDRSLGQFVGVGGVSQGIWMTIEYALQGGGLKLSPAQRSAVAQAIGKVPGVRTLGRVDDPNGVPAIGFERSFDSGRRRSRVFFDASTAMTTYFDETISKVQPHGDLWATRPSGYSGAPVGTVIQRYEMLDFRYLDAMPQLRTTDTPMARQYCPELRHQHPRK